MNLTKDITSVTPQNPLLYNMMGDDNKNLLDLSPSDVVFYVGGYPDNFTVSWNEISHNNNVFIFDDYGLY